MRQCCLQLLLGVWRNSCWREITIAGSIGSLGSAQVEPLVRLDCAGLAPHGRRQFGLPSYAARVPAFTLSGVNGTERRRTPIVSNTALEIAEGATAADGTPAPHGGIFGRSIRSMTISGISGKVRIG